MKNICIISNFEKTYLFNEATKKIKKDKIFWIVVNRKQNKFLLKKFKKKNILYLPKIKINKFKNWKEINKIKINEALFADRNLKIYNKTDEEYLVDSIIQIVNFIKKNKIKYVIGEITWAIEFLTFQICREFKFLKVKYLNPSSIRIPQDRFIFFTDLHQSKFDQINNKFNEKLNIESAEVDYNNYIRANTGLLKNKSIYHYLNKFWKLIFNDYFDNNDPTRKSKINRLISFLLKVINYYCFKLIYKKNINFFKKKKLRYIFFAKKT